MRAPLIALTALMLTGCAPKAIYTPVNVDMPVPVPCHIQQPASPSWLVPGARNADLAHQVEAITEDLDNAHGYIGELEAAINSCNSINK